jgi:hypothetical protein
MADDQTVDEGARGFLNIFGSGADTPDTPDSPDTPDEAPTTDSATVAADDSPPEQDQDDGPELTAEERVAANLAAALDEEGYEVDTGEDPAPVATEAKAEAPDGEVDLDRLTPEELRAYAEEAIKLRAEIPAQEEQRVVADIQVAEQQAAGYWQSEQQRADAHYRAELTKRIAQARSDAETKDNPDAYFVAEVERQTAIVETAKKGWLSEQGQGIEAQLQAYRQELLKPFYARQLVKEAGLPASAAQELLADDGLPWQRYAKRVDELVAMRNVLAENQSKADQKVRAEGRKRLIDTAVVVPTSGRAKPFKRARYEGTAAEGLSIIKTMSKMKSG